MTIYLLPGDIFARFRKLTGVQSLLEHKMCAVQLFNYHIWEISEAYTCLNTC